MFKRIEKVPQDCLGEFRTDSKDRLRAAPGRVTSAALLLFVIALVAAVLEGALRKWVIGSEAGKWSYLAYFSKDILFGLIILAPASRGASPALEAYRRWLVIGCFLFLSGAAISALHGINAVGSILTLRATVLLPVLAMAAALRLQSSRMRAVAWVLASLTVLNFGLSLVQLRFPADHWINRYVVSEASIVEEVTGVRATGTFSYITGLALMSSIGIWAGMVLLCLGKDNKARFAGFAAILAGFGCGLTSMSRGPILVGAAMLVVWLIVSRATLPAMARGIGALVGILMFCAAIGILPVYRDLSLSLLNRHKAADDSVEGRAFGQVFETAEALRSAPLGRGLGSEQIGGNFAAGHDLTFTTYESQFPRIVMESGFLGLLGFLAVCAAPIIALQIQRRKCMGSPRDAALLATQLLLAVFFYTNLVFNHTASAFAWIITAVALVPPSRPVTAPTNGQRNPTSKKSRFRSARIAS